MITWVDDYMFIKQWDFLWVCWNISFLFVAFETLGKGNSIYCVSVVNLSMCAFFFFFFFSLLCVPRSLLLDGTVGFYLRVYTTYVWRCVGMWPTRRFTRLHLLWYQFCKENLKAEKFIFHFLLVWNFIKPRHNDKWVFTKKSALFMILICNKA
jgi:hypothetical protein